MSFDEFTLLSAIPRKPDDPVRARRQRLAANISRQIDMLSEGNPSKSRRGRWFREIDGGRVAISLRYGKAELELAKGKFAVSCTDRKEAIAFLRAALIDVEAAKFDQKLEAAATAIRDRLRTRSSSA